jgi:hypothetical protein
LKSEIRVPEIRKKSEIRKQEAIDGTQRHSDFDLRISFGFRISDFRFQISRYA